MSVLTETLEIPAGQHGVHEAVNTLAWRRAFLHLPLAERRRQMAAQAALLMDDYAADTGARADWQGGTLALQSFSDFA